VLGAGPGSLYFEDRLDAAADLYKAGKVRHLLVSGAGDGEPGFTETDLMRTGLIQRHVPAAAITCDEAGVRTLDSMARARLVFGLDSVVIVSQSFHLPRAIFLAHHWGLDAVGYAADDPGGDFMDTKGREWLARVLAVADTTITHRQPRTLGAPQPIQLTAPGAASPALVHGIN
jgi:vancomycin permeability regulator SanA